MKKRYITPRIALLPLIQKDVLTDSFEVILTDTWYD